MLYNTILGHIQGLGSTSLAGQQSRQDPCVKLIVSEQPSEYLGGQEPLYFTHNALVLQLSLFCSQKPWQQSKESQQCCFMMMPKCKLYFSSLYYKNESPSAHIFSFLQLSAGCSCQLPEILVKHSRFVVHGSFFVFVFCHRCILADFLSGT